MRDRLPERQRPEAFLCPEVSEANGAPARSRQAQGLVDPGRQTDHIARLADGLMLIPDLAALLDADAELLLDRALTAAGR